MRPTRLRESPHQGLVARFEKQHTGRQDPSHLFEDGGKLLQPHPLAHIHHQRRTPAILGLLDQFREPGNQVQRKVIDRVVSEIFKGLQRRELA